MAMYEGDLLSSFTLQCSIDLAVQLKSRAQLLPLPGVSAQGYALKAPLKEVSKLTKPRNFPCLRYVNKAERYLLFIDF